MRLMSFAKTWTQFLAGSKSVTRRMKQVWTDGEVYFPDPHNKAYAREHLEKIWIPAWWNHRTDEPTLKPGEILEGCQWSPRVGPRWCCPCGVVGAKANKGLGLRPECACGRLQVAQAPARGVFARHIETTIVTFDEQETGVLAEPYRAAMLEEARREGFPGMPWSEFLKKHFAGVPPGSQVARVQFERIEAKP